MLYENLHKYYRAEVEFDNEYDNLAIYFKHHNDAIDYLKRIEVDADSSDYSVFTDISAVITDIDVEDRSDFVGPEHVVRTFGKESMRFDDSCRWFFDDNLNTYDYLKIYSSMCDHDIMNYATKENFYIYENSEKGFEEYLEDEAAARNRLIEVLLADEEELAEVRKDWEDLEVIGDCKFSFIL